MKSPLRISPQAGSEFDPQQSQNDANFMNGLREKAATRGGQRVHCIYRLVLPTPHDSNPACETTVSVHRSVPILAVSLKQR